MSGSFLTLCWIAWGAVTSVFVVLMIWRSLVGLREDNVVILDPSENRQATEQQAIIARVERLTAWTKRFAYLSGALLLVSGSIWAYRGYLAFTGSQIP